MKSIGKRIGVFGVVAFGLAGLHATPAFAQASRTWVSGVGDDANPCSRTAPCKTFAGAFSRTAVGGEINCLDPGGFGAVTITKSLSIYCDFTEGGILSAGTSGVIVNGAGADVYLSGLDIEGFTTGVNGIRFISGNSLHVMNSTIRDHRAANGTGILFTPNTAARLYLQNDTIANNGSGTGGGGVLVKPSSTGTTNVVAENVRLTNNVGNAFAIDTTGLPSVVVAAVLDDLQLSGSTNGLSITAPAGGGATGVVLTHSIVEQNSSNGIVATGPGANVRVGTTNITGNGTGVSPAGGSIGSYGDNLLDGNGVNGSFSGSVLPKH